MAIDLLLSRLLARIPEVEWQLKKIELYFSFNLFPEGLFRCHPNEDARAYSNEIRADIKVLSQQTNPNITHFLAIKINQKINVLVSICSQCSKQNISLTPKKFNIDELATRQQWIKNLEAQVKLLKEQKVALTSTLLQVNLGDSELRLKLHAELGQLRKALTLAEEAYTKATT